MFNQILFWRTKRKEIKKLLSYFQNYIAKGMYLYCGDDRLEPYNTFSLTNFHRVFRIKGCGTINNFSLKKGSEKAVMVTQDLTYAKYFGDCLYARIINKRIVNYINQLKFPHTQIIKINPDGAIISNTVHGTIYNDHEHSLLLIDHLIKYALSEDEVIIYSPTKTILYVQHGDIGFSNIIWEDNNSPIAIDNELVDYFPAFYDLFLFVSRITNTVDDFSNIYHKYFNKFEKWFNNYNIVFNWDVYDYYISLFVFFRYKAYTSHTKQHRPFVFLTDASVQYKLPKTHQIYKQLINNEPIKQYEALCTFLKDKYSNL